MAQIALTPGLGRHTTNDEIDLGRAEYLNNELDAVLTDPVFVRSPVLARLLGYLVRVTLEGHGKELKSFSVAVEGLGRSDIKDPQIENYARVQVGRLRKALDAYYSSSGGQRDHRLMIGNGSYEVRLVPHGSTNSIASQDTGRPPLGHFDQTWSYRRAFTAIALTLLVSAMAAWAWIDSHSSTQQWKTRNFPYVSIKVHDRSNGAISPTETEMLRQYMAMNLDKYEGLRVAYSASNNSNYIVANDIFRSNEGIIQNISVVDLASNREIWSTSNAVSTASLKATPDESGFLSRALFMVAHPTGVLHSNERKREFNTETPYGCWLQFTAVIQDSPNRNDSLLTDCAKEWHSAAPNHPIAAALFGWAEINRSQTEITESARDATINDAIQSLERAAALNPNSAILQVSAMRAYSYVGDRAAMRVAADKALSLNPNSLDIKGVVGTMFVLQGDQTGEPLVDEAIRGHFNPPTWYFIGKYVAAMMRDDVSAAALALKSLQRRRTSMPVVCIFETALEARQGQLLRARAAWARAEKDQPLLAVNPSVVLERLPGAPAVKNRLKQWLAPVVH